MQFPGVVVFSVFKMKFQITRLKHFAGQTVRVFKEVGKLIEKHGIGQVVLFTGWRAVATKEVG